jgi:hypothetical protein
VVGDCTDIQFADVWIIVLGMQPVRESKTKDFKIEGLKL